MSTPRRTYYYPRNTYWSTLESTPRNTYWSTSESISRSTYWSTFESTQYRMLAVGCDLVMHVQSIKYKTSLQWTKTRK